MTGTGPIERTVMQTRDGVPLATDLWLAARGEKRPVMLLRTPYGIEGGAGLDPQRWVNQGWAVVLQDVRGRYRSGGVFDPFRQEIRDGQDAVQWAAAQPWSDGRVVTVGMSYDGGTQWLAASTGPASLRAISPVLCGVDARDGWMYENRAFRGLNTNWSLNIAASRPGIAPDELERIVQLRSGDLAEYRAHEEVAAIFPPYRTFLDYDDASFWQELDVSQKFAVMDVAGYHTAGWYDVFCEGGIAGYTGMRASAASDYARTSQRLVIGPWSHASVYGTVTGSVDFGPQADGHAQGFAEELNALLTNSLDRRDVPAGVRAFVMGANRWTELPGWPPPCTAAEFFLDSGEPEGRLLRTTPAGSGEDRFTHDPRDPVPSHGGRTLGEALMGPWDQRDVEARPDVLVYSTEQLDTHLWVMGEVRASVWFSTTAADADVVVKLVDVLPDGSALNVVEGARRIAGASRPQRVELAVGSTAHCFQPGHRIRVEVASASFPRIALAPRGDQTVFWGGRTPSSVTLPVVPEPR
jgi:putative CocE/NonD family hydrolase